MKTIVLGLPYFSKKIAENLSLVDKSNRYVVIDTGAGFGSRIRFVWHIISANVLYQVGGSHICGGSLKLALFLNKKIVMHWVGTDVQNLQKAYESGTIDSELIKKTRHLCEVNWIQNELKEVGIESEISQIACFEDEISTPMTLPKTFSILTYVSSGREEFYGINKIIALAEKYPSIEIRIAGIIKYKNKLPANITLLGWVNDMADEYRNCTLYLRLAEHDGLAFSVLEAMAHGRHVGYTYAFPYVNQVQNFSELHKLVADLLERFKNKELDMNIKGYEFVSTVYGRTAVMQVLSEMLNCSLLPKKNV